MAGITNYFKSKFGGYRRVEETVAEGALEARPVRARAPSTGDLDERLLALRDQMLGYQERLDYRFGEQNQRPLVSVLEDSEVEKCVRRMQDLRTELGLVEYFRMVNTLARASEAESKATMEILGLAIQLPTLESR